MGGVFLKISREWGGISASSKGEQHGIDTISAADVEDLLALEISQNAEAELLIESLARI